MVADHRAWDHLVDLPLEHVVQKEHHLLDHSVGDHGRMMMGLQVGHKDADQTLVDEAVVYH